MKLIKKFFVPVLAAVMIVSSAVYVSAGAPITEEVSILNPKQNIHGNGYEWDNPHDTLTLTNLNIQTEDDYGLKLPDHATVILKGKNYIKASKAALFVGGDVIIKGSGSLILYGGEYGILCNSTKENEIFSITGGRYEVTGGTDAIRSMGQKIELSGGSLTLSAKNGYAVNARELSTAAGVGIKADSSLFASYSMLIQGTDLEIGSAQPALICDKSLKLESMDIKVGEALSSVTPSESYNGEKAVYSVSTLDNSVKSILFGENYSIALDIIILVAAILILVAAIVVPKTVKRMKALAIIEANEAAEKAAKAEKKRISKDKH